MSKFKVNDKVIWNITQEEYKKELNNVSVTGYAMEGSMSRQIQKQGTITRIYEETEFSPFFYDVKFESGNDWVIREDHLIKAEN